jgi:hypothetical protein
MAGKSAHPRRPSPEGERFLETLVFLRALYAERGPLDSRSVASVSSVVTTAEMRMRVLRISEDRLRRRFIGGEVDPSRP